MFFPYLTPLLPYNPYITPIYTDLSHQCIRSFARWRDASVRVIHKTSRAAVEEASAERMQSHADSSLLPPQNIPPCVVFAKKSWYLWLWRRTAEAANFVCVTVVVLVSTVVSSCSTDQYPTITSMYLPMMTIYTSVRQCLKTESRDKENMQVPHFLVGDGALNRELRRSSRQTRTPIEAI